MTQVTGQRERRERERERVDGERGGDGVVKCVDVATPIVLSPTLLTISTL
jgi:hypothetical protein